MNNHNNIIKILTGKIEKYSNLKKYDKCVGIMNKISGISKLNKNGGSEGKILVYNLEKKYVQYKTPEEYDNNNENLIILNQRAKQILSSINNNNIIKAIEANGINKFYNVGMEPIKYIRDDYMNKGSWLGSNLYHNPYGLWFGCGSDWQNYINSPSQWTFSTHLYEIEFTDNVFKINSVEELKDFINKYKNNDKILTITNVLNWDKIKEDYDGMVICPYLGYEIWGLKANKMSLRGDPVAINEYIKKLTGDSWKDNIFFLAEWYRHWETGSGVIWRSSGIKDFRLVQRMDTFDKLTKNIIERISAE